VVQQWLQERELHSECTAHSLFWRGPHSVRVAHPLLATNAAQLSQHVIQSALLRNGSSAVSVNDAAAPQQCTLCGQAQTQVVVHCVETPAVTWIKDPSSPLPSK
jgi:hypothetical protein